MRTERSKKPIRSQKPVAVGMGLVALDLVFAGDQLPPKCYAGGTCCNVLTILSYLGWRSLPISRLRGDTAGERLVRDLRRWHVSTQFVTQLDIECPALDAGRPDITSPQDAGLE